MGSRYAKNLSSLKPALIIAGEVRRHAISVRSNARTLRSSASELRLSMRRVPVFVAGVPDGSSLTSPIPPCASQPTWHDPRANPIGQPVGGLADHARAPDAGSPKPSPGYAPMQCDWLYALAENSSRLFDWNLQWLTLPHKPGPAWAPSCSTF